MGEFPSGQRGQTVNLLAMPSVVRIHLPPPSKTLIRLDGRFAYPEVDSKGAVLENMPVACFPRDPARPQAGESTFLSKTTCRVRRFFCLLCHVFPILFVSSSRIALLSPSRQMDCASIRRGQTALLRLRQA